MPLPLSKYSSDFAKNQIKKIESHNPLRADEQYDSTRPVVKVCHGHSCGGTTMAERIHGKLKDHFKQNRPDVQVVYCPCTGYCSMHNNVVVNGQVLHYQTEDRVAATVERQLFNQQMEQDDQMGPISRDEADDILGL